MYLEHFKLSKNPFSLTPNTEFYCELPNYQEALNVLTVSLANGEGFIKIIGEVGTGKTLLCRLLLNAVADNVVTAYIPNPDLNADGLRIAVAKELGLTVEKDTCQHTLIDEINSQLIKLRSQGKQVVLIVDEAQCLSESCLEAIRLLTNLETETEKLLQVVLFAQPELDVKLNQTSLRQLKQRITFSYYLKPLNKDEANAYISHRMAMAGYTHGLIFSKKARDLIYKASGGLPRLLNVLCHKGLIVAYGRGDALVSDKAIKKAIEDTESAFIKPQSRSRLVDLALWGTGALLVLFLYWKLGVL